MRRLHWTLPALAACAILAACGGGGTEDPGNPAGITSVKVMGDSLADSGTFATLLGASRTFTVQGSSSEPNVLWTERVTANVGAPSLCAFYRYTGATFNATPGCTAYAVGGARINAFTQPGGQQSPFSVIKQITDAAAVNGSYKSSDLILMDGGGNDAADLIGAYLAAAQDGGASYAALIGSLLPAATVQALMPQPQGPEQAGAVYMTALADLFHGAIKSHALEKGAERIAVLNIPPVTLTPRFQMVLGSIAASKGAAAAKQAETLFDTWVKTFNARLVKNAADDKRLVVVDFYDSFQREMADPAQYGLTNVTSTACPPTGVGSDGLPTYNFATCTARTLSDMTPPAGATGGANWWTTYAFSDGFHPTPYGHQLMGQMVAIELARAGWL
ncbi:SGNH/GDSL hydrolase family protein [Ottowia caeni]|uniref:SGNH/GDSL hydrolase family protein n=1 Tax=Ottowia caeni TaxID=2870339 RepID=UPI001E2C7A49|nr:phospholipase [Ottowia caeni]